MEAKEGLTAFNPFLLIMTEIVLPSADVVSDLLLIIKLTSYDASIHNSYVNRIDYNILGYMMIVPLCLSTILLIPHWWKQERIWTIRLLTAPLLLFQCWPQYTAFRILWLRYIKKNVQLSIEEFNVIKGTIGTIGKHFFRK